MILTFELFLLTAGAVGYVLALRWLLGAALTPIWLFGFLWLLIIAVLAILLAAGKVEEATSAGLKDLVVALAGMGGMWGTAAFQHVKNGKE